MISWMQQFSIYRIVQFQLSPRNISVILFVSVSLYGLRQQWCPTSIYHGRRQKGTRNYNNHDALICCIWHVLPNSKYGWQAVAIAYQEALKKETPRNTDDLKRHWIKMLCNNMKKPTDKMGADKTDQVIKCIADS